MKTLKRYDLRNTTYFITCVTYQRRRILTHDIALLWQCWGMPKPMARVLLPDHFHFILNKYAKSISDIMHSFKITFSRYYRNRYGAGRVWQNRYWDHIIRDESDLNRHIDYIHYNPIKHGLAKDPFLYPHSSLKEYADTGYYSRDWGVKEADQFEGEFGE
jgi:putative transposase